jgi:hypothetical protein
MTADELKTKIDETLADNPTPLWDIRSFTTAFNKSINRAVLLFVLGLPGSAALGADADIEEQELVAKAQHEMRCRKPASKVDWQRHWCTPHSLAYITDGTFVCINLSTTEVVGLTDGTVFLASSNSPFGGVDPTCDNDCLAPATCVWIALKKALRALAPLRLRAPYLVLPYSIVNCSLLIVNC